MSSTDRLRFGLLMSLALVAADASAQAVGESPLGNSVERQLSTEQTFSLWARDPDRVKTEAGDRLEKQRVLAETFETVKLKNVIPPIHFESGVAKIPDNYVAMLRKALDGVRDRRNVRLHLVGHADSQRLSPTLAMARSSPVSSTATRVVPMPSSCGSLLEAASTRRLASSTALSNS